MIRPIQMPIPAEFAMSATVSSSLVILIAAVATTLASANVISASWITIKNDTKQPLVVQETMTVNGKVKRCKPVSLLPGESLREFLAGPAQKKIDVFDGQNPNRTLWSGSLHCKDESQTYSIVGVGGTVTVRPAAPGGPRTDRK
jgi:hypothetical protein